MSGATSGAHSRGMNFIDEYQAEIAYRREQMLRSRRSLLSWRWHRSN